MKQKLLSPGRSPKGQGRQPKAQRDFLATVKAMNPNITSDQFLLAYPMALEDIFRLRHFLAEYQRDYNIKNAAVRMGYPPAMARNAGALFFSNAYVQLRLAEILESEETKAIVNGNQVIAKLWEEANKDDVPFSSNSSTRIAALRELSKILRLGEDEKADGEKAARHVMVVPLACDPTEWEEHARKTQAALKDSVIDV